MDISEWTILVSFCISLAALVVSFFALREKKKANVLAEDRNKLFNEQLKENKKQGGVKTFNHTGVVHEFRTKKAQ